jgi:hypothetical protein
MSKMGSHDPFEHLQHKLWPKERLGIKLAVWPSTMESRESTWFPSVQVACDMPLKRSWRGLQLLFRPHPNRRSGQEVIVPRSCGTLGLGNFGTPIWESRDKKPFGCHSHGEVHTIWGKVVASPKFGPWWVLWIRGHPWLFLAPKVF